MLYDFEGLAALGFMLLPAVHLIQQWVAFASDTPAGLPF